MERRRRGGRNKGRNRDRLQWLFPRKYRLPKPGTFCCSHVHTVKVDTEASPLLCEAAEDSSSPLPINMSFPQLGYQYIRPIYPPERQGIAGSARAGTELSPSGALSNVLSSMYGSPFAAAAQGYGAFLPYSNDISIFNQLVSV